MVDRTPRVLVDATAVPPDRGGVGRYVDELLPELDTLGTRLVIVSRPEDGEHYGGLCPGADVVLAPGGTSRRPARLAWEQTGLPRLVAKADADVVHSPHYTMPLAARRPVVVTLHDATFFTHPDVHLRVKRTFFRSWIRRSLRSAAACVVPSAATRDELVRVAGAARERLDVIHLGVDAKTFGVPDADVIAAAREHIGIGDRPYIAFLGTLEPRKNLPALVRGYAEAFAEDDEPPTLVLAGGRGWDADLSAAIAAVPDRLPVLRPGYLPAQMLRGYLGGATVVAYPSLGEGFGLPVLEAMSCGAPVLTTRRLALPEVGGDAVAYTEPDAPAIATALRELVADEDRRKTLAEAGLARAAGFTWRAAAEAHLETYDRVARTGSSTT